MRIFGKEIERGFVRPPGRPAQARASVPAEHVEESPLIARVLLAALVAAVSLAGLTVLVRGVLDFSGSTDWTLLAVLTLLAVAAERADFSMYGSSRVSLAFVPIFAATISCGVTGLAVVIPFAVIASSWGARSTRPCSTSAR